MYSNGLHQGVSGIEEGDPELSAEASIKTTLALEGNIRKKVFFNTLFYYNRIADFIYLSPTEEFRLTIRGAFPVFKYAQTNATLRGMDLLTYIEPVDGLNLSAKFSFIKGWNETAELPLINIPSNSMEFSVSYEFNKLLMLKNASIELSNQIVVGQDQALAMQDFSAIPAGYHLLNAKISALHEFNNKVISFYVRGENLLNNRYRNYLNRQRYFADDLGRNISAGINYKF